MRQRCTICSPLLQFEEQVRPRPDFLLKRSRPHAQLWRSRWTRCHEVFQQVMVFEKTSVVGNSHLAKKLTSIVNKYCKRKMTPENSCLFSHWILISYIRPNRGTRSYWISNPNWRKIDGALNLSWEKWKFSWIFQMFSTIFLMNDEFIFNLCNARFSFNVI